jgi:hypothetical protein
MSYIVNQARVHSLTIGGVDYTSALVSWTASDSSANRNGFIVTSGALVLGSYSGGPDVEDYDRNDFKRGIPVILTMRTPAGATYRHPRGLLYIISTSYDVEGEQLEVQLGCRLAMAQIMDDPSTTVGLSPIPLDPAQRQLSNISAAFATAGKYLYQDNNGNFVSGNFFGGDSEQGVAAGQWTSILGVTAISAAPLAGTGAIPDLIKLTYSVPEGSVANDQKGRIDTEEVFSNYWLDYPASLSVRQGDGTLTNAGGTNPGSVPSSPQSDPCGNTPPQPSDNGQGSCQEGYSIESRPWILPAQRYEISKTYYGGPAGQQDFTESSTFGPIVEANSQYFADDYAYCIGVWATNCQPGGGCSTPGMTQKLLGKTTTRNYFGTANELVKQVQESYVNMLSMAKPQDWRSGLSSQGVPEDFRRIDQNTMIRSQVRITTYYKEDNANIQKTVTYTSVGNNGSGISVGFSALDAYSGVVTSELRRSTSTATLDVAPDIVNSATTSTVEQVVELPLFTGRYTLPPAEAGPYEMEESAPMPLLFDTQQEIQNTINSYASYLVRFTKGDAFGLQIGEGLREDVGQNWFPGMPFRYYDPKKNKVLAMRMDATSWGVTKDESAFVTNGIWCGTSNGTVTLPQNVLGASTVTDGGSIDPLTTTPNGPTAPEPPVVVPPVVDNETDVDNGTYAWVIKVDMMLKSTVEARNDNGVQPPQPDPEAVEHFQTMVAYCQGMVVQAGGLLTPSGNGDVPLENGGTLITAGATVVTADLFV